MDKAQVASILEEVGNLLELSGGNPFETRAYGEPGVSAHDPGAFDLAAVPDYLNRGDDNSVRRALAALSGDPFGG